MILGNRLSVLTKKTTPTKLKFHLTSNLTQPLYLTQSSANAVTVDWGDGSATEQSSSLAASFSHKYAAAGDYEVKVACADGESWKVGAAISSKYYGIIGEASTAKSVTYPTLTEIEIGTDITALYAAALSSNIYSGNGFFGCSELAQITLPPTLTTIGFDHNDGLVGLFSSCTKLKRCNVSSLESYFNLNITDNATNSPLNNGGLLYINGVPQNNIVAPNNITKLDTYHFSHSGITGFDTNNITKLYTSVFSGCKALTTLEIGQGCTNIDTRYGSPTPSTDKLSTLLVDNDNATYYAANNCIINSNQTIVLGCKNSIIPNDGSVTKIGECAFYYVTQLSQITIPSYINYCDYGAFTGCSNLKRVDISDLSAWLNTVFAIRPMGSVTDEKTNSNPLRGGADLYLNNQKVTDLVIPSGITVIKQGVFDGCTSIQSLTLHNNVSEIRQWAFENCTNLTQITSYASTPPTLGKEVFKNVPATCAIYVPAGSVDAYKAASGWSTRASYIQAIPS